MTLDEIGIAVRAWAAGEALIRRVYLFGSRAKGTAKADSDVDFAIMHDMDPKLSAMFDRAALKQATWMHHARIWQADLQCLFSIPIDVQAVGLIYPTVWGALKQCRVCLYRRI
jgi:predicted nucleotidyltransferase